MARCARLGCLLLLLLAAGGLALRPNWPAGPTHPTTPVHPPQRGLLSGYAFGLDPGHGGKEGGAQGPTGLREEHVNSEVVTALSARLRSAGAVVWITRPQDSTMPLKERSGYFNRRYLDAALSVHHNAVERPDAGKINYTCAYIHRREEARVPEARLASYCAQSMARGLGVPLGSSQLMPAYAFPGVKQADFHMVREVQAPAVLTEGSFISYPDEETRLKRAAYRELEAEALYVALLRFTVK